MSDEWYDSSGYPTRQAIDRIRTFHGTPRELIEFITDIWWPQGSPMGSLRRDSDVAYAGQKAAWVWYVATGGWSGNEEIIDALESTHFWMRYWHSITRGGGYEWHIPEPDMHRVEFWGDLNLDPDIANRCPDCRHMLSLHNPDCRMGVGGGELCGCDAAVNTIEAEPEKRFVTEVEGLMLENVHPADNCAGQRCVIHNPSDHHMRGWQLLWRDDRSIFERVCPHGVGHPDPDQFEFWEKAAKAWRPSIAADVIDDPYPSTRGNPWEGMGVHGCDGCCR